MNPQHTDIMLCVFDTLSISAKRCFIRTCKDLYKLFLYIPNAEIEFRKRLDKEIYLSPYFCHSKYFYKLHKYTIELLADHYHIPDRYIISENEVFSKLPGIYKKIGECGKLKLFQKMVRVCSIVHTRKCVNYAINGASKMGQLRFLKWIYNHNYINSDNCAAEYAAKWNQIDVLMWMKKNEVPFHESNSIAKAVARGHIDVVKYLLDDYTGNVTNNYYAARKGALDMIKYLQVRYPASLSGVCEGAASAGNIDILEYAYACGKKLHRFSNVHPRALTWLINKGHLNIANLKKRDVHNNNFESIQIFYLHGLLILDESLFVAAVSSGNIDFVKWLYEIKCPYDFRAAQEAARRGLEMLKLLVGWGVYIMGDCYRIAVMHGDTRIVKYLHKRGHTFPDCIPTAVRLGNLQMVVLCVRLNYAFDEQACAAAADWGSMKVLRWLRGFDRDQWDIDATGIGICPWNSRVCANAIRSGHVEILEFALKNDCEFSDECHGVAIRRNQKEIVTCIRKFYPRFMIE